MGGCWKKGNKEESTNSLLHKTFNRFEASTHPRSLQGKHLPQFAQFMTASDRAMMNPSAKQYLEN
uniref:Uncharacterized protein n=1 Tax=Tolypothrix bouteillei VB521301 TaxID=1479485 RepID=A0A0C1QWV1_9CYAN